MPYKITKERCQNSIDSTEYICDYCGGKLEPIETVDNSNNPTFWTGCKSCSRFTAGCPPTVFEIAKRMVEEHHFRYYKDETDSKDNISKAAQIVRLVQTLSEQIKEESL